MIKRTTNLFLLVTALFSAFTLGFFAGRNYNPSPVQISHLSQAQEFVPLPTQNIMQAAATEASVASEPEIETTATEETTIPTETDTIDVTENIIVQAPPTEAPQPPATEDQEETTESSTSGLININTASASLLMTLPGIGEVLAQRIVEYREANGPFPSVAALTNVKGIGEKRLAAIIHLVTV